MVGDDTILELPIDALCGFEIHPSVSVRFQYKGHQMKHPFDMDYIIGYLTGKDRKFKCLECIRDHERHDPINTAVYRVNIGIYSQVCKFCKTLVVDGVKNHKGGPLEIFDQ